MLSSTSWSQFFIAVAVIVVAYYVITILLLYSGEIKSLLKGGNTNLTSEDESAADHPDVLGTTRETIRPQQKQPAFESQLTRTGIAPKDPLDKPKDADDELLTGAVADLLDEIKTKVPSIESWQKDECLAVFRELLQKYPQLRGTVYQESISYFISNICADHFEWNVQPEEISDLWN